ncbi:hypothetical protein [Aquimarina sp. 2201CG14-23]|uniref:hypothetical protein n=1 Tax=Aquimarina mycalae TaxID=3040073 RepID=UPI0024782D3A|nr:hypothetical protein [Aquimarina sp. 2201CG14-23]MDH7444958.1 hypothetical protein [Aquimarina sp. 2201CG14-23]
MKKITSILILILLIGCKTTLQEKVSKNKNDFSISLGSCFKNDEISIELNGAKIFQNEIITSDKIIGSTGYYFSYFEYKNEGKIIIQTKDKRKQVTQYLNSKDYKVKITINGYENYFLLELSKGRNIMIEKCTENGHLGIAQINYYRGIIDLD